jgi:cyclohexadieny/prephenate dehydrogenase
MSDRIRKVAIIGQGLIGSSITRAIFQRDLPLDVTITDGSRKVCERLLELGLGRAKVVFTNKEAVEDADLVIGCVPVASYATLVKEIAPYLKAGAILSDVGSVKSAIIEQSLEHIPDHVHFVPAHPLAGTEFSGPDAGKPKLFVDRWCILTPSEDCDEKAVEKVARFWESIGSKVQLMSPQEHDYTTAVTSHLPHLSAFSIFHTARFLESDSKNPVIEFSAGTFRDVTRVALSNPQMWRDIFLLNHKPLGDVFRRFVQDMQAILEAAEQGDGERLEALISESRKMRTDSIHEDDFTSKKTRVSKSAPSEIIRPYSSD